MRKPPTPPPRDRLHRAGWDFTRLGTDLPPLERGRRLRLV